METYGRYPNDEILRSYIEEKVVYVLKDGEDIAGMLAITLAVSGFILKMQGRLIFTFLKRTCKKDKGGKRYDFDKTIYDPCYFG